jgi:hypothetical protein
MELSGQVMGKRKGDHCIAIEEKLPVGIMVLVLQSITVHVGSVNE